MEHARLTHRRDRRTPRRGVQLALEPLGQRHAAHGSAVGRQDADPLRLLVPALAVEAVPLPSAST